MNNYDISRCRQRISISGHSAPVRKIAPGPLPADEGRHSLPGSFISAAATRLEMKGYRQLLSKYTRQRAPFSREASSAVLAHYGRAASSAPAHFSDAGGCLPYEYRRCISTFEVD